MDVINNICFVCLNNTNNLSKVIHEENGISIEVKYALPELIISDFEDPVLYICFPCQTTLRSFYTFKKKCLENYSRLKYSINILQGTTSPEEQRFNEVQIRKSNCELHIKQESDVHLNIKKEFEDLILPCSVSRRQIYNELHTELDYNAEMIKQEPEMDNEGEVLLEEQSNLDHAVERNINKIDEPIASEDSSDQEHYNELNTELDFNEDTIKQEHVDIGLNAKENDEQCYLDHPVEKNNNNIDEHIASKDSIDKLHCNELHTELDYIEDTIKQEHVDIDLNCKENEVLHDDQNYLDVAVGNNIDNTKKSPAYEDTTVRDHIFVKFESVLTSVQNIASDSVIENNIVLYKKEVNINTDRHKLKCPMCNKYFLRSNTLTKHMNNCIHVSLVTKKNTCSICLKNFSQKSNLNKHLKMHEGKTNFECTICNKKFILKWSLQRHMKYHLGIKNMECSICKKKFVEKCKLTRHMKIHESK